MGREYYLKDYTLEKFNLPILEIMGVDLTITTDDSATERDAYYSTLIPDSRAIDLETMLLGAENTYLETLTRASIPFKRRHQLRGAQNLYLQIYPTMGIVEVVIKTSFPNLSSIPEEFKETLMDLAKLDVKIKLYNELKYLEDVVTPSGNLNLKISDWDSAERDRTDFIKDLRIRSFPDRIGSGYFTIV